uniref:Putative portal protein n=1 Tax=viral metagenome TaxID=1070528 RepID=A0A6M3LQ43_9ZZZZ
MTTIWKFPIDLIDSQFVPMPKGAKILTCQLQGNAIQIWAKVSPDNQLTAREIRIYGTGHNIDEELSLRYISTFQSGGGTFIFHVFEVI